MASLRPRRASPTPRARHVPTPEYEARRHYNAEPAPVVEVLVADPGFVPATALVDVDGAGRARRTLRRRLRDLPRLEVGRKAGAVDLQILDRESRNLKMGQIVLEGPGGVVPLALDAATRRFRAGGIAPGEYRVRAASSAGSGETSVTVRAGDVVRAGVRLDEPPSKGKGDALLRVSGRTGTIRVRARDVVKGRVVYDKVLPIVDEIVRAQGVPFGRIHWYLDDAETESCYDDDHTDLSDLFHPIELDLRPKVVIDPEPPDWRFGPLDRRFAPLQPLLSRLGIDRLEQLAAIEPEALMHRAEESLAGGGPFIDKLVLSEAIADARAKVGAQVPMRGLDLTIRSRAGAASRSIVVAAGTTLTVDIGADRAASLIIEGPEGRAERQFREAVTVAVDRELLGGRGTGEVNLKLAADEAGPLKARLTTRLGEADLGPLVRLPSTVAQIEMVYQGLATRNPGLGTEQPPAVMQPENIDMWLDRARTHMIAAGVCSVNDLGRFRLDPMRILRIGAYIAPASPGPIKVLTNYAFVEQLSTNIRFYRPNDVLHETAVVLAGDWDIRGQTVIIGADVRELVVIARRILHDGASRISWETTDQGQANAYWPNPAPGGANGGSAGQAGADGADGDPDPHPSRNGGRDAVTEAPIVTMFVFDTTNNLPPIDLKGQAGGAGGRGQDGGRGGDGSQGLRADGTFFGGCCRGVGWGGDGGRGGDAGLGGRGGRGGEGGKVTLLTSAPSIAILASAPPPVDLTPGSGGPGGPAGDPGGGGLGGPAGTADCETWCDEHPERRGTNGTGGASGQAGFAGDIGPAVVIDAFQILPITEEQWQAELNNPHILDVSPVDVEPGETVSITGQNLDPAADRVFFDGFDVGPVASATSATFVVPSTSEGGYHPVVVRPVAAGPRRSNRVMIRVVPVVDAIPAGIRWTEGQTVTLTGLAFRPGLTVLAEDRSATPPAGFSLPVVGVTRTSISVAVPGAPLGGLRGVRRIVVRNPDSATSRAERVVRISDTIVVRCAAFRVVGATAGIGTTRTATDIANLFAEGAVHSVTAPWGQARVSFRLVQPPATITVADDLANVWPILDATEDMAIFNGAPAVTGSLNFFFVRDVEVATAYAYFGGGPLFIGDEGGPLGDIDWQQVVAHEIGHSLCLRHICDGAGEGAGTFFDRECEDGDEAYLMYPFWDTSNGMAIDPGQVDPARVGASHFEDGKVAALPVTSLFQGTTTSAQCLTADTAD